MAESAFMAEMLPSPLISQNKWNLCRSTARHRRTCLEWENSESPRIRSRKYSRTY
jgi:hypothetical protein